MVPTYRQVTTPTSSPPVLFLLNISTSRNAAVTVGGGYHQFRHFLESARTPLRTMEGEKNLGTDLIHIVSYHIILSDCCNILLVLSCCLCVTDL